MPLVLGYHFLARTQPSIDWTCPVVRVAKMDEGEEEVDGKLADGEQWWGLMSNLQAKVVEVEEVMPTLEDQQTVR